jgi:hypothetical protein
VNISSFFFAFALLARGPGGEGGRERSEERVEVNVREEGVGVEAGVVLERFFGGGAEGR